MMLVRHLARWAIRLGGRRTLNTVLRMGGRTAIDSALGAAMGAVPKPAQQSFTQVFAVKPPVTVYVRASHCRVVLRRVDVMQVTLQADMRGAFGLELAAEQDEAGVYIVARRKPVVGQLSHADFTVTVPTDTNVVFHLTPGDIVLQNIQGRIDLPAMDIHAHPERFDM